MRTKRVQHNGSINGSESQTRSVSRRSFLGTTLAGGAALYAGGLDSLTNSESLEAPDSVSFLEKSIPELQELMNSGALSSLRLTFGYLGRIHDMNQQLRAVIQTNPLAIAIALQRDFERRLATFAVRSMGFP